MFKEEYFGRNKENRKAYRGAKSASYDFIKEMRISYLEAKSTITGSTEPLNALNGEILGCTDCLNEELKTSEFTNDGVILNDLYIYNINENIIKNVN